MTAISFDDVLSTTASCKEEVICQKAEKLCSLTFVHVDELLALTSQTKKHEGELLPQDEIPLRVGLRCYVNHVPVPHAQVLLQDSVYLVPRDFAA